MHLSSFPASDALAVTRSTGSTHVCTFFSQAIRETPAAFEPMYFVCEREKGGGGEEKQKETKLQDPVVNEKHIHSQSLPA